MRNIKFFLSRAHRECGRLLAAIEDAARSQDWSQTESRAEALVSALAVQIASEEEVLFPCIDGGNRFPGPLSSKLRAQHAMMRVLSRQLTKGAAIRDARVVAEAAGELAKILRDHSNREESAIVPAVDTLRGVQADRLIANMEHVAESSRRMAS
jgi:hypothetical protein